MPLLVHSAISAMDGGLYHADSCCNFKVHESIGDVQHFGFPPTGELAFAGCYHSAEAMHLRHDVQQSPVPNGLSFLEMDETRSRQLRLEARKVGQVGQVGLGCLEVNKFNSLQSADDFN